MIVRGIDVSSHQGAIDWSKVGASAYGFAVARMTIGRTTRDTRGRVNLKAMLGKVPVAGAYGVVGTAEPVEDGAKLLVSEIQAAGADSGKILVMLDAENFSNGTFPSISQVDRYARQLHALIGRWPVAYVPGWWLNGHGFSVAGLGLANCLWAPSHYLPSPWTETKLVANKPASLMGFRSLAWLQYTDAAAVAGVSGRVDANVFYGSLAQMRAQLLQEDDVSQADVIAALKSAEGQAAIELAVDHLMSLGLTGSRDGAIRAWARQLDDVKAMATAQQATLDDEAKLTALAQAILSALQADPAKQIDVNEFAQRLAEVLHILGLPVTISDADIQRNLTAVLERAHVEVAPTP